MPDYQEYLSFVENYLKSTGSDQGKRYPFRSRITHTKRVVMWAKRLCSQHTDVNEEVLLTAAIFHDIGYGTEPKQNHQYVSAELFRTYAAKHQLDPEFTEKVAHCVETHSDIYLMKEPEKLSMEQLLLMEADLLDEEGALAICWDCMACELEGGKSYREAYERTIRTWKGKLTCNPMVTKQARDYWDEKQAFIQHYLDELSVDLEEISFPLDT